MVDRSSGICNASALGLLALVLCLTAGLSSLWAGGRCGSSQERRFQAGLKQAKADIDARRFEAAGRWLAAQSAWRPDHAEAAFLLGVCEDAAGRHEAAVSAWARVPLESRLGAERGDRTRPNAGRRPWAVRGCRSGPCRALADVGPRQPEFRYLLNQLFYWEGRLDEMRRLLQEGWNTSPDQAGDLRDLWLIDSAVVMVDPIRAAVEQAARKAPDDDRVWLARANLALLRGSFPKRPGGWTPV